MPVLAADVAAKYRGRAAIIATSVINGAMTDLAKRAPAADVAGGARAQQGDEAGRPGLQRAPPVRDRHQRRRHHRAGRRRS